MFRTKREINAEIALWESIADSRAERLGPNDKTVKQADNKIKSLLNEWLLIDEKEQNHV